MKKPKKSEYTSKEEYVEARQEYNRLVQIRYPPIYKPPYSVLYIDPPWDYSVWSSKGRGRSASQHYETQGLDWLKQLPVSRVMAPDSALCIWATAPNLEQCFDLVSHWTHGTTNKERQKNSWEYKTILFSWLKRNKGDKNKVYLSQEEIDAIRRMVKNTPLRLRSSYSVPISARLLERLLDTTDYRDSFFFSLGHYTRSNLEVCLLFTRGKGLKRADKGVFSVLTTPIGLHSAKPLETRDRLIRLFGTKDLQDNPVSYLEGFARSRHIGFDAMGFEYDGLDATESINQFLPTPYVSPDQLSLFPTPRCKRCRGKFAEVYSKCPLCGCIERDVT